MKNRRLLFSSSIVLFLFFSVKSVAGPPFRTDDPQPVDFQHWEFYIASMQQFDHQGTSVTAPHFEINYGIIQDVQLHLVAPLGYVHTTQATHYGYSDTELGVKYRFIEETETVPQIGIFPLVELPTGNEDKQLGAGKNSRVFSHLGSEELGKLDQRTAAAVFGIIPCPVNKIGCLQDGNFSTIFQKFSRWVESCVTRLPTNQILKDRFC